MPVWAAAIYACVSANRMTTKGSIEDPYACPDPEFDATSSISRGYINLGFRLLNFILLLRLTLQWLNPTLFLLTLPNFFKLVLCAGTETLTYLNTDGSVSKVISYADLLNIASDTLAVFLRRLDTVRRRSRQLRRP